LSLNSHLSHFEIGIAIVVSHSRLLQVISKQAAVTVTHGSLSTAILLPSHLARIFTEHPFVYKVLPFYQ